jgi:hypothetical protein
LPGLISKLLIPSPSAIQKQAIGAVYGMLAVTVMHNQIAAVSSSYAMENVMCSLGFAAVRR